MRLKLILKSYSLKALNESVEELTAVIKNTNSDFKGPIPLPTKIRKFDVLRSPHVDKKARDQLEVRTHKRLIEVIVLQAKTLETLMKLAISTEVEIRIKL